MKIVMTYLTGIMMAMSLILQVGKSGALGQLGNPRSSYELGSAVSLKGRNLLVSLFVDTPEKQWTKEEQREALAMLKIAEDYIEEQAKAFGVSVDLITDCEEDERLFFETKIDYDMDDSEEAEERLDESIAEWVEQLIDYDALCEEFDAQGIATLIYFNQGGRAYAICYDGIDNPKETLIMYSGETPAVYAHEILHLFGAHDLYRGAEYTDDACAYVKERYPMELMITVSDHNGRENPKAIENVISPLTAYHLGWCEAPEEIERFPQFER